MWIFVARHKFVSADVTEAARGREIYLASSEHPLTQHSLLSLQLGEPCRWETAALRKPIVLL